MSEIIFKIGIYEFEDGRCDIQFSSNKKDYFEFGAINLNDAEKFVEALKNAQVAVNPGDDFWDNFYDEDK